MTEILFTKTNEEDGIAVYVTRGHMGFHVSMKDLDADEFVGVSIGCPTFEQAKAKAEAII